MSNKILRILEEKSINQINKFFYKPDLLWNAFLNTETGVPVIDREAINIVKSMSIK